MKERFASIFNDFIESDLAILLVESWAFIADMLSFKMDHIVNEIYIDSVTEIENAFRLANLVGFKPTPPIAAKASFSATIVQAQATDLIIPTPVVLNVVSSNIPISYELFPADENNDPLFDQDIIISSGSFSTTSVVGIEGQTRSETSTGTGEVGQTITLSFSPVIFDSVRVDVDGVRWEEVDFFTDSQPRREYRVEFNSNYEAFVIFGNNKAGLIPSVGSTIVVTYRTGGGTIGNIVSNFINTQRNFELTGLDFSVPVTFVNYTRGEFGYNGDTIEDIRRKLPAYIRTQDRAVTGDDYKTIAEQFSSPYNGQVGKATAILRNNGCSGNIIDMFVLAKNGLNGLQEASNGLKVDLQEEIDTKKMLTDFVCIRDGSVILTDVTVDVVADKFFRKFKEEIQVRIERRLSDFFALVNWDYGQDLREADIVKVLSDIPEIERVDVTFVTDDPENSGSIVTARFFEVIRPDTTTISFTFQ